MSGPGTDSDGGLGGLFSGVGNAVGNVGDTMTGLFGAPAAGPGTPSGGTRGEGLSHGGDFTSPEPIPPQTAQVAQQPENAPSITDFLRNPDDFVEIPAFAPGLQESLARQISAAFGGDEKAYHDGLSKIYAPVSAPILDEPITQMNEERRRQLGLFGSAENA